MKLLAYVFTGLMIWTTSVSQAQEKKDSLSIKGDMGIWYEGYGLDKTPGNALPDFYRARKPWNLVRYTFNPILSFGKWSIPINFNFSPMQNNFITAMTGGPQSLWQFVTNPVNNFGIRPKIGNTEFLLGTQNLLYSALSTGDLGVFGYGVNLSPGKFRVKLFNGVSQRPINYEAATFAPPFAGVAGAYQRNMWMAQLGMEKEGKYFAGFNFVKSIDKISSVTSPPLTPIDPQENMVVSFLAKYYSGNGWGYNLELGQSFYTRNLNTPLSTTIVKDFNPFIQAHTSTGRDNAVMLGIDKKGKDWQIGAKFNYFGAGYYTAGYQFMTNDRMEYLGNARFNAWGKKINVVASMGERFGNLSHTSGPDITKQVIANINAFTQFTDKFSLNLNFNNYGFNSPGLTGYKSVSNELSANPVYTWSNSTMSNLLSGTYTRSKYDETTISPAITTHNNTQTLLLLYVPTFFNKKISPDFSIMWFNNLTTAVNLNMLTASGGMNWIMSKKITIKGQLQYILSKLDPFTANKNVLVTGGFDWKMYKKLTWQFSATGNIYRFGSELQGSSLTPVYAGDPHYLESTVRTGLQYKF
jgi:hypothetical protein